MKKKVEMSLRQARKMYKENPNLREWLLENFDKKDLESKVSQEKFNEFFLSLLEKYKNNFRMIEFPSQRFEVYDEDGDWLFDINYNPKNAHFWYSHLRISPIFVEEFGINDYDISELMKYVVWNHLGLHGVTPEG